VIGSVTDARAELHARVLDRREEIEAALAARVFAISTPAESADPAYIDGLRSSLAAALEYGMDALRQGERRAPAIPTALTAQARMAARNGVELDVVLRRYVAGYAIFNEFVIEEAERSGLRQDEALQEALRGYAAVFDRLVAAVSEEHAREAAAQKSTTEEWRTDRVRRLLAGEPIDTTDLGYELKAHHLALLARGPGAQGAIRELAERIERPLLLISPERDLAWGWLRCRWGLDPNRVAELIESPPAQVTVGIGESAYGLNGWRISHRQAQSAHTVAIRSPQRIARYREVALLASILRDELLVDSLRRIYLEPLDRHREGGDLLREALEAYFACNRNASSAAAALELDRRTLTRRLRIVEQVLDGPLDRISTELEAALRLKSLEVA
jgi:DNA-binding PucR family transcriptional regulator